MNCQYCLRNFQTKAVHTNNLNVFLQIGMTQENNVTYISSCNTTCPEDCSTDFSLEFHKGDNPKEKMDIIIGCSTHPNTSDTVRDCLRNFDYTKHPNAHLLPKNCGEQKSGWENTVSQ